MPTVSTSHGFAYLPLQPRPFSAGVIAARGHALVRVRPRAPLALADGLAFAARHLTATGLALGALAALELRMPAPLTPDEFAAFNGRYTGLLREHGFLAGDAIPIARSNMAQRFSAPRETLLHAFTYAAPCEGAGGTDFLISGKPELGEGGQIIAAGDASPAGIAAKARFVIDALRATASALGADWHHLTAAQAYTAHPLDGTMTALAETGLATLGLTLVAGYPPVRGLDFEVDVRAVATEYVI